MTNILNRFRYIRWVALVVLLALAIPSALQGSRRALNDSCDFQHDWLAARLTLAGQDPYAPFLGPNADSLYPQGTCPLPLSDRPPLSTPLLGFLLIPIQGWDWEVVKVFWVIVQLASGVGLAATVMYLDVVPGKNRIYMLAFWILVLFGWLTTRAELVLGQTALITAFFAFLSIGAIYRKQPIWAGIFLGLALCKFSMTWGLLAFFLVYRQYRTLLIAAVIQAAGVLLVALAVHESPIILLKNFVTLVSQWSGQKEGVVSLNRLAQYMGLQPQTASIVMYGLGGLAVIWLLWSPYRRETLGQPVANSPLPARMKANLLVVTLTLISLSFVYHRIQDLVMLLVYFPFVASFIRLPNRTVVQERVLKVMIGTGLILWLASMPPPTLVDQIFPDNGDVIVQVLLIFALLIGLLATLWSVQQLCSESTPGLDSAKSVEGTPPAAQEVAG